MAEEGDGARGAEPDSVRWDEMDAEIFCECAGRGGRSRRGAENRGAFGTWRLPIRVRGTGAGPAVPARVPLSPARGLIGDARRAASGAVSEAGESGISSLMRGECLREASVG